MNITPIRNASYEIIFFYLLQRNEKKNSKSSKNILFLSFLYVLIPSQKNNNKIKTRNCEVLNNLNKRERNTYKFRKKFRCIIYSWCSYCAFRERMGFPRFSLCIRNNNIFDRFWCLMCDILWLLFFLLKTRLRTMK